MSMYNSEFKLFLLCYGIVYLMGGRSANSDTGKATVMAPTCMRASAGIYLVLTHLTHVQPGHEMALMPVGAKPLPVGSGSRDKCSLSEVHSHCFLQDPGSFQHSHPQWLPTK